MAKVMMKQFGGHTSSYAGDCAVITPACGVYMPL